ncbi:hypothetical protein [Kineococcus sp. SYSU DK006]|uniref:hypothetical protein n=1 Tax=Kineococcus sp. SYSU DK006 TaxID=3383127 RepID=UPI003D7CD733
MSGHRRPALVPWLLLGATAVPLALSALAVDRVLTGALDGANVPGPGFVPAVTAAPVLSDRLLWALGAAHPETAVLTTVVGVLLLAAASRLPGGHRLAPGRAARRGAVVLAAAGAAAALLTAAAVLWCTYGPSTPLQEQLSLPPDASTIVVVSVDGGSGLTGAASLLGAAVLLALGCRWLLRARR